MIVTDRRGWGCSERFTPGYVPDVDVLTDDILAVMEAAGSERAAILATYESAIVASLFAATYPERARANHSRSRPSDVPPHRGDAVGADPRRSASEQIRLMREAWARPTIESCPRYARGSVTPGGLAAEIESYLHTDIRAVLPTIQVPTLVLVDSDRFYEVLPETGHFIASKIAGARVVEHSSRGGAHFHWYARGDAIVSEVGRLLAEISEEEESFDRILATILFTDIVDSTKRAAKLGDRGWRELVERHHAKVRTLLARYRGTELDNWTDPDESDANIRWARDLWEAMQPLAADAVYVNNLGDEGEERVREAYSRDRYERLVALKDKYDATNLFRLNQNIRPMASVR